MLKVTIKGKANLSGVMCEPLKLYINSNLGWSSRAACANEMTNWTGRLTD